MLLRAVSRVISILRVVYKGAADVSRGWPNSASACTKTR